MNVEITAHPKLQHLGLATGNLDAMVDWYGKVLGMTINRRLPPAGPQQPGPSFSAAFVSNDEVHHRMVFFERPGLGIDPEKPGHVGVQHIAFEYETLDDLLSTYVRLKGLSILPMMAADFGMGTAFYYEDPDRNIVELNINNYGDERAATEHMRTAPPTQSQVDPDKMITAREAGMSPWDVHERAAAGDLAPAKPWPASTGRTGAMAA